MPELDRPQIRKQLKDNLRTDPQLMEFLTDYFPEVERKLADGMSRDQKLNLLIQTCEVATIKQNLDLYVERESSSIEIDISQPKTDMLVPRSTDSGHATVIYAPSKAELAIADARRQHSSHPYGFPRPKTGSLR